MTLCEPQLLTPVLLVRPERLQGEVLEELQELVIVLGLRHLLDLPVEQIRLLHIHLGQDLLYGAVYNPDHILMLADLASPDEIHDLIR